MQPQANLVRVKNPAYSSLAAFLAHYHALESAASLGTEDALDSTEDTPAANRHRDRAELQLRRELAARGIIAG